MAFFVADITIIEKELKKIKIVDTFMSPVTIAVGDSADRAKFLKYAQGIVRRYKPDALVIERFQVRGNFRLKANIVEYVNWEISMLDVAFKHKSILVTACSWKNIYQKKINKIPINNLKDIYKQYKKILTPHQIDAALMCLAQFGFNVYKTHKFLNALSIFKCKKL